MYMAVSHCFSSQCCCRHTNQEEGIILHFQRKISKPLTKSKRAVFPPLQAPLCSCPLTEGRGVETHLTQLSGESKCYRLPL